MHDLVTLFRSLNASTEEKTQLECFSGISVSDAGNRHLGKDSFGRPAILLLVSVKPQTDQPFGVELENLRIEHQLSCRITSSNGQVETDKFTLIQCLSTDPILQEYFLKTIDSILDDLPNPILGSQINLLITNLVTLFRALAQPPSKFVAGLWAELFLIARSSNPKQMLHAWHSEAVERYDFSWDSQRLEVKASSDRISIHHFSYEQVYPPVL